MSATASRLGNRKKVLPPVHMHVYAELQEMYRDWEEDDLELAQLLDDEWWDDEPMPQRIEPIYDDAWHVYSEVDHVDW